MIRKITMGFIFMTMSFISYSQYAPYVKSGEVRVKNVEDVYSGIRKFYDNNSNIKFMNDVKDGRKIVGKGVFDITYSNPLFPKDIVVEVEVNGDKCSYLIESRYPILVDRVSDVSVPILKNSLETRMVIDRLERELITNVKN